MQLHIGTYQDANRAGVRDVGRSCGFDAIDDRTSVRSVGRLLDWLAARGRLPACLLYVLDPSQMEAFAALAGAFSQGRRGKVQLGAPWWFNDHVDGIRRHLNSVSSFYPLGLSAGMLTDSRSFFSYPRHELYRRLLCDYLGRLVERGEYYGPERDLGELIRGVCHGNAKELLGL
jgi:glucuronate isomerase